MDSIIVRKLSDGEELVVVGQVVTAKSAANPRDSAIERRRLAMRENSRGGPGHAIGRIRSKE